MNFQRICLITIMILVVIMAAIGLMQLWGFGFGWDVFIKLMITLGALIILGGLLMVFAGDLSQHKKMKDENYLD